MIILDKGYKLLKLHGQKKIIGSIILFISMTYFSILSKIWYLILIVLPVSIIMFIVGLQQIKLAKIEKQKDKIL